jgi:hypothetical protein
MCSSGVRSQRYFSIASISNASKEVGRIRFGVPGGISKRISTSFG